MVLIHFENARVILEVYLFSASPSHSLTPLYAHNLTKINRVLQMENNDCFRLFLQPKKQQKNK